MLHFEPDLSRARLSELAEILIQQGRLAAQDKHAAIDRCAQRLQARFGINLEP
jgi:hypothetical protein